MDSSVAEYVSRFDGEVRERLETVRALILETVPEATEGVGYGIAQFWIEERPALYLGAFAKHMSLYPVNFLPADLATEAEPHLSGKATAKFVHTEPLPLPLITRLVRHIADNFHQGLT